MKVMFAVPAYQGIDCPAFTASLAGTIDLFEREGIEHALEIHGGCCYVQVARNELAQKFLESDSDKLFFIDDDISWDPQGALAVARSDRHLVGGVYPKKYTDGACAPFPVILKCSDAGIPLCDGGYLRATRTVGGFTCADRSVFEDIREANPHLFYAQRGKTGLGEIEDRFDFFPQGVKGGRWVGEDYAFCDLWAALGEEIAIIPDITFGHHRNGTAWYGNLWRYIRQLPGGGDHGKKGVEKALWVVETDVGSVNQAAKKEAKDENGAVDAGVPQTA